MAVSHQAAAGEMRQYECKTQTRDRYGWVPPNLFIQFDAEAKEGWVFDGLIARRQEEMLPVSFEIRSDTSYYFRWKLEAIEGSRGTLDVSYRLTFFADRNAFSISGILHGADNDISGNGRCTRI